MEQRFIRNIPAISEEEQRRLRTKRAVIVGCGGLGGYLIEFMARAGVGQITVVDGDVFDESNLNRQTLSLPELMGVSKAAAAAARIKAIDPDIDVRSFEAYFGAENAGEILADADIVLDALDNIPSRLELEDQCARRNLVLVHGAIQGWMAQISLVKPGSGLLHTYYGQSSGGGDKSVMPHVPPFCAAVQSGEAIKFLCGRAAELEGQLLVADLRSMDFLTIKI